MLIPDILFIIYQFVLLVLFIVGSIRIFRKKKSTRYNVVMAKISIKQYKSAVCFQNKYSYEKGRVRVSGYFNKRNVVESNFNIKWLGKKIYEESFDVDLYDLCSEQPLVLREDSFFVVELPAVRITNGDLKNVLIMCLNTERSVAKGTTRLVYDDGYVKADILINSGLIKTRVEWIKTIVNGSKIRDLNEKVRLEYCVKRERTRCSSIAEVKEPGVYEHIQPYPSVKRIFISHLNGSALFELADLIKDFPIIWGIENSYVRLNLKRGWKKVFEAWSKIERY